MNGRLGIPAVLAVFVVALLVVPTNVCDADVGQPFYVSQLDDNGATVYEELGNLSSSYTNLVGVEVTFDDLVVFDNEESAIAYGKDVAADAMAARYYTDPMVPYLWDLPVKEVDVDVKTEKVKVTNESSEKECYVAASVSFQLSVPERMADDPVTEENELALRMGQLSDAVKKFTTDASVPDAVRALADHLRDVKVVDDEEGEVSNIYDALVDKESSSAGIAAAFTKLAAMNYMDAMTVKGEIPVKDSDETRTAYWNYVEYEDEWYAADVTLNNTGHEGYLMAGYASNVVDDGVQSSFGLTHTPSMDLSSVNSLTVPELTRDGYEYPVVVSFFDEWGEKIMMLIIGIAIAGTMIYFVKKGNY